jgi:hypothetical protein
MRVALILPIAVVGLAALSCLLIKRRPPTAETDAPPPAEPATAAG